VAEDEVTVALVVGVERIEDAPNLGLLEDAPTPAVSVLTS
jgi:hypothetical protein